MAEECLAAEAAQAAAVAAADTVAAAEAQLPPITPVQSGGSSGSGAALDGPPRPSQAPAPQPVQEENEDDEDLQEAIRLSLLTREPTTAPTTRAPNLPGTASHPAGGSSWHS